MVEHPKDYPVVPEARAVPVKPAPIAVTSEEYTAPLGGVVDGHAYMIDGHLVIAAATAGAGTKVAGRAGVVEYAKVHEQAWTSGDDVHWDAVGACLSNVAARVDPGGASHSNVKVGVADKDAPNPSVTGFVRLDAAKK